MLASFDAGKLKSVLVEPGFLTEDEFRGALAEASEAGKPIDDVLLEKNLLSATELSKLTADAVGLPFIDLNQEVIPVDVMIEIPELVSREYQAVAFGRNKNGLQVAFADPTNRAAIEQISKKIDHKVIPFGTTATAIATGLAAYPSDYLIRFKRLIKEAEDDFKKNKVDDTVVELVDSIIEFAIRNKASDIHIEPYQTRVLVRFRVDGVLHHIIDIPKAIIEPVLARIKVMSKLRLDEHSSAQDGKIKFLNEDNNIDIRVSVAPITSGEKVVMRLLSDKNRSLNLTDLGLSKRDLLLLSKSTSRKQGMILSCGPTGSGKTTTLYALVKKVNSIHVNIASIEDPVEYDVEGVNQIQVNSMTNLTFAKGLRTILRQDPDIIMVGEIRDIETAAIAANAAMTGHLMLSSLHTNDAATAIPRLIDMEVEPFILATSLNVIVGQRLVRKICNNCRVSYNLNAEERSVIAAQLNIRPQDVKKRFYRGKGCSACGDTGYSGRIGVFETLQVSEEIKKLIVAKADAGVIKKKAIEEGMVTMLTDALSKAASGTTTIDEVISEVAF